MHYVKGESVFTRTNKIPRQFEYLTETMQTEVIIIGGGITGASVGYYMAKSNISAVILEKNRVAHGSTAITTSLLQYELDGNIDDLKKVTPCENIVKSYKLGLKALKEIELFIKKHGNNCDYEVKDTLLYTNKVEEIEELKKEYEFRKGNGFDVEFISEENNRFSFDIKAGVYSKNGGAQLDPFKFTYQLLEVACEKGLKVYENTEVMEVEYFHDYVEVTTNYGYRVRGQKVIVATGYNIELFTNKEYGKKTTTYNIATAPLGKIEGWPGKVLIRDNEDPYHYLRTTKDNRIIIGGEDVDFKEGIENEILAYEKYELLEKKLKEMFKDVHDIKVEYKYCGAFDSTRDNLGFIGRSQDQIDLWYCLGYGANGILFGILGGMMLSQLYHGEEDEDMKLFSPDREA